MKIAWERHGAGPPLLLIHGLGYARWGWEPVVEPLARIVRRRSCSTTAASARATRRPARTPPPRWPADAVQVLDEAGVERAHVVGTSLGGMVAQELALGYPERVDKLVLACTTPGRAAGLPDAAAERSS